MVVTATTLLLKSYARVHDWASKGTSLGGRARLSSWLFSLLRCKMSLILPKRLYGITAQGYDSILVVVDQLTKMVHFIPTTEKTSAEGLARLFRDNV